MLVSCFKEDDPIPPHDPGDVKTESIELMNDYRYQVYYDMNSEQVVSTNLKKEWDLGFECSDTGWHILLNTASFMVASGTGTDDFSAPIDTTGFSWKFDKSDGNLDSTAIGSWFAWTEDSTTRIYTEEVYVIDRGYDEAGNLRGLRKIVFQFVDEENYVFTYANMDGGNKITDTVTKDPTVNFMCYSFDDGGKQINFEPPTFEWDLLFTQYTTLLYTNEGDPYPYIVTGVLSNRIGVEVARDTLMDFQTIDLSSVQSLEFTAIQDEIGYDWKDVTGDVTSGNISYEIIEGLNYLIRSQEGYYYKLRFISFYNNDGEKGYPTFEYQRL
jgi:hypothetical protein